MIMDHNYGDFVWDAEKELANIRKHGIDFSVAAGVFKDPSRKIYVDAEHSKKESRYFCLGLVGGRVITVRFIHRDGKIRIFGAGYWRKGARHYETQD